MGGLWDSENILCSSHLTLELDSQNTTDGGADAGFLLPGSTRGQGPDKHMYRNYNLVSEAACPELPAWLGRTKLKFEPLLAASPNHMFDQNPMPGRLG